MKKILSVLLVLSMLLSASAALAEGMGVQVIGGPETETEPVSLDDIKTDIEIEIDGYGIITPSNFAYADMLRMYKVGDNYNWKDYHSGAEAEYAMIDINILNTTTKSKDYLGSFDVQVIYDDVYIYGGWAYQYNWNNRDRGSDMSPKTSPIQPEDNFAIEPMYEGHYVFGCTLSNAIVNSKKPLRMVITIDGNELAYNIRK